MPPHDHALRLAAFEWLARQVDLHGDVLPWGTLLNGFHHRGERVPLLSQQGIFKPKALELPLSIRTSLESRYDDGFCADGLLRYRYRGTDPGHRDNVGLRQVMSQQVPLVYFHAVVRARYLAVWPVYIVDDDQTNLTFSVAVDDSEMVLAPRQAIQNAGYLADDDVGARRRYVTALVRRRLHQRGFREKVLAAYRQQCALCQLRHEELLDAAHIQPESEEGEPTVRNGVSLCKLHHAAFDAYFLTIRPDADYRIEVRPDILSEEDGPMLLHGLQGLQGERIFLPRNVIHRPDLEALAARYERFRRAAGV